MEFRIVNICVLRIETDEDDGMHRVIALPVGQFFRHDREGNREATGKMFTQVNKPALC